MEVSQDHWISAVLFEHACKQSFTEVIQNVLDYKDLALEVLQNSSSCKSNISLVPKIKPVFLLISLLKKLHSLGNFCTKNAFGHPSRKNALPMVIELLESTYKQYNFISLKRFLTLISELKLLDLLNLVVEGTESAQIVQKLNQYFPRCTPIYRTALEKDYSIENTKVLEKVIESHTQCRRLILKLAVDKSYKSKYLVDQYAGDMDRLIEESRSYIMEIVTALELVAGSSVLEKIVSGEEGEFNDTENLSAQLLLDYIQPEITEEALLRYLDDLEPTLSSQPTSGLTSCLMPFDTMSEDEDSDESQSEYECSQDDDSVQPPVDILPPEISTKASNMSMDVEDD